LTNQRVPGCSSIANASIPASISACEGHAIDITSLKGVFISAPSANVYKPNQVLGAGYDSQRPMMVRNSSIPFCYTPSIDDLEIETIMYYKIPINDSEEWFKSTFSLKYILPDGSPEDIVITENNQPFKTIGIVYLNDQGELITVTGNTGDGTLYDRLLELVQRRHDPKFHIPPLVKRIIDFVFPKNDEPYIKDNIKKAFMKYMNREGLSLSYFTIKLDKEFASGISPEIYQSQIDNLRLNTIDTCQLQEERSTIFVRTESERKDENKHANRLELQNRPENFEGFNVNLHELQPINNKEPVQNMGSKLEFMFDNKKNDSLIGMSRVS
jgi:hypothetical protein